MTKIGTFEDLMADATSEMQPIAEALREVILKIDPQAVEVVRLGDRAATYGLGPKKMSEGYVYIMPHKAHVNLGFYRGAHLADPKSLLEGTGANMRHMKIRTLGEVKKAPVKALIRAALKERKAALG